MGLGDEANKDHHPTPSGTNTGGWPPYPLGWPGFIKDMVSVRDLSRLTGTMSATTLVVLPAPLHYRELQDLKIRTLKSFQTMVFLNEEWKAEVDRNAQPVERPPNSPTHPGPTHPGPRHRHRCITPRLGSGHRAGGLWSEEKRTHHINRLELAGGALATKTFTKGRKNIHVLLRMDNTTGIAYINRMGGTRSQTLSQAGCDLWHWCLQQVINLSAVHLPGMMISIADGESRTLQSSADAQSVIS